MRIFGREPAVIIGFIGAVITVLVGLKLPWLDAGQATALGVVVTSVLVAAATRPVAPALFVAAFGAVAVLFAQYGIRMDDALVAGIGGLILGTFGLFRGQVTPAVAPRTIDGTGVVTGERRAV